MLKELFYKQRSNLEHFFDHLDHESANALFEKIKDSSGVLFFTGIGKSGFVAQKIAATMMSTGTKAFYLPPIDALHGDLAMVSKNDMVLFLSKSGETEELLQLLPFVRKVGAETVAITSNKHSRLTKACDFGIELPCQAELCPFDLAPTISAEIQLLFGDVLAIGLMQEKGFSMEDFAHNHPGGRIGKRASLKVRDLMLDREKSPFCFPQDKLEDVLVDFSAKRCGCLVVVDEEKKLQGIFTDGDLRRALQSKGEKVLKESLSSLMTPAPKHILSSDLAWEAMKMMESDQKSPCMVLPVLEKEGEVVGLIKLHDLIQAGL